MRKSIEVDLKLLDFYDELLNNLELYIVKKAKGDDVYSWCGLRSMPGVGKILSLILLYEIHDINRFPTVQTSSPIAAWSSALESQMVISSGPKTAKSATPTSNGPSLKRLVFSSEETSTHNTTTPGWSANTAKKGSVYPGSENRPSRLLHAQTKGAIQYESLFQRNITARGRVCEPIRLTGTPKGQPQKRARKINTIASENAKGAIGR